MKVLVFCSKGFETMEFSAFIDVLGWARNDYNYDINVDKLRKTYFKYLSSMKVESANKKIVKSFNERGKL